MLSDVDLTAALARGELVVDPLEPGQVQPASIDLRLSDTFATLPAPHTMFPEYIDPTEPARADYVFTTVEPGAQFPLEPGGFALGSTVETVRVGLDLVGILAGKSTLARHGLMVEAAGWVDPLWCGQLTVELFNQTRRTIMLTPGMRIAQLAVDRLETPCRTPYGSKRANSHYQGQKGPTPPRPL